MTTDQELVAYAVALEKRVDRLKTLEDVGAGGGGWTFITSQELAGVAASMTFNGIPQTFDDLMIIWRGRSSKPGVPNRDRLIAQFNGDTTGGNYDTTYESANVVGPCLKDNGYVVIGTIISAAATGSANAFSHGLCLIPNYRTTSYKKTTEGTDSSSDLTAVFGMAGQAVGNWQKSPYEAISSIKFYLQSAANLLADTTIELYGLTR
jgi:hypothetical protein